MVTMATPTPIPRQNSPLPAKTPISPGVAGVLEALRRLEGRTEGGAGVGLPVRPAVGRRSLAKPCVGGSRRRHVRSRARRLDLSSASREYNTCPRSLGELGPGDSAVEPLGGEVVDTDHEAAEVDVVTGLELHQREPLPAGPLQLLFHEEGLLGAVDAG